MEYPALVYRCPGAHFGPDGATYDSISVQNATQLAAALADGWAETLVKAVELYFGKFNESVADSVPNIDAPDAAEISEVDESAPPTREELEEKANEIGIKFDGRTTDRKLQEKIEEALRGK